MDKKTSTIVFDMDGTIADFYSVSGWKDYLDKEDVFPYVEAKPKVDIAGFRSYLECLKKSGAQLQIVSWTSKGGSILFNDKVRKAKLEWLRKYDLLRYFDHVHIVEYGTPKYNTARRRAVKTDNWFLYDDDRMVRVIWDSENKGIEKTHIAYDEKGLELVCTAFKACIDEVSTILSSVGFTV